MPAKLRTVGFNRLRAILKPDAFEQRLKHNVRKATIAIGALAEAAIKQEITQGKFRPNSAMTVAIKGSGRPLVNTGELSKNIKGKALEWDLAVVGILRRKQVKDEATGQVSDIISVATILHNGAVVPVSNKMRRLFYWLANHPSSPLFGKILPFSQRTTEIVIKKRPFLRAVYRKKNKARFKRRWDKAVQAAISGRRL